MIIKLKYFGIPIPSLGGKEQSLELPSGTTIEGMLDLIRDRIDGRVDDLSKAAIFLVNKVRAEKYRVLKDEDEVIIMYSLAGG